MVTLRGWIAEHPPPDTAFRRTLAEVAERAAAGEDLRHALRELLDEFALLPRDDLRERAIAEEPALTGDARHDALLAAVAEHLAGAHDLERPAWCLTPRRFLAVFWFVSDVPGFRAAQLAQSPAAFRRRGIMIAAAALARV